MKTEIQHKTERRTPAEMKLAAKILKLAAKTARREPDPQKIKRAERLSRAAKKSPRFEANRGYSSNADGCPIHYFHTGGQTITGILGEREQQVFMACTYPLVLDDRRVVHVVAHRRLRKIIDHGDYVGRRIRITYDGKLVTRWGGHYEKAYTVELDDGGAPKTGSELAADNKERARNVRRKYLQDVVAAGRTPKPANLKEFAGETWADAALEEAKEGK